MNKNVARIILLVMLLTICVPMTVYFVGGGLSSSQEQTGELDVPDEDPLVSEDDAMNIVMDMLPGSDYGDITDFSQSYNEGGWIYKGVIEGEKVSYEYEVDGDNGNLLKWVVVKK